MSDFDAIFDGIQNSKAAGPTRNPRLPIGTHTVILKTYGPKRSTKQPGQPGYGKSRVQGEFILESTVGTPVLNPGTSVDHAWFPNSESHAGVKEQERAKQFLDTVAATFGDTRESKALAAELTAGKFRGMRLRVTVTQALDRNTRQPLVGKNGPILNASWEVIAGQTVEGLAPMRVWLDENFPIQVQAPAPAPAPAQPAYQAPVQYAPPAQAQTYASPQNTMTQTTAMPFAPPAAPPMQYAPPVTPAPSAAPALPAFLANLPKVGG